MRFKKYGSVSVTVTLIASTLASSVVATNAFPSDAVHVSIAGEYDRVTTNRTVWSARVTDQIYKDRAYSRYGVIALAHQYIKQNADADPVAVLSKLNEYSKKYEESQKDLKPSEQIKDYTQITEMFIDQLAKKAESELPGIGLAAKLALKGGESFMDSSLGPTYKILNQFDQYSQYVNTRDHLDEELKSSWQDAQINPSWAHALDVYIAPWANAAVSDDAATIYHNNPEFRSEETQQKLASAIGSDGKLRISKDDLINAFKGTEDSIVSQIKDSQKETHEVLNNQGVLMDWIAKKEEDDRRQQESAQEAAKRANVIAGTASALFATSSLLGLIDPELGRETKVIGGAAMQIWSSIDQFNSAAKVAERGRNFMRTAALASNIVGAGMALMSLFGGGMDGTEILMKQLQELQKQVAALHEEMRSRFDQVDEKLNQIYSTMVKDFELTLQGVNDVDRRIQNLQASLINLRLDMNDISNQLTTGFAQIMRGDLQRARVQCLGANDLFTSHSVSLKEFENCIAQVINYGTQISKDDSLVQNNARNPESSAN